SPNIVPNFESDISELVAKRFKQNGVEVFTNAKAKKAVETTNGVAVEFEVKGKTQMIEADYVMVTVGRRPNTENLGLEKAGVKLTERNLVKVDEQYRTSQKNIFAIGDIVEGLALAHKASYEAKVAAEVIG
ncbi:dihydrolipoyl dehydrogenase, partial [Escherichia coli]